MPDHEHPADEVMSTPELADHLAEQHPDSPADLRELWPTFVERNWHELVHEATDA